VIKISNSDRIDDKDLDRWDRKIFLIVTPIIPAGALLLVILLLASSG
jgi:hypothetical protein